MKVQWAKNPFFAEVAEALKCRTEQIFAIVEWDDYHVAYVALLPDLQPELLFQCMLARDDDEILHLIEIPEPVPQLGKRLNDALLDVIARAQGYNKD